jgi:hemoglobin-like flavoprotein
MTPTQIELVQTTWARLAPVAEQAAELFYGRLFSLDPSLKALFRGDMKAQGRKLMTMISFAVKGLRRLDALVPAVQDLGRRHAGYGVKDEHYATVGAALLATLAEGLGEAFTEEAEQAWTSAYELLAATMRSAAAAPAQREVA